MSEFAANNPWILVLISVLLGALAGVLLTLLFERRKSGGRSVEELEREMNEYKEEVGQHFATTSELFRDMTEKYRDVYNHLASGSQSLCEDSMELARLEFTEAKRVDADDTDTTAADSEVCAASAAPAEPAPVPADEKKPEEPPLGV